MILRKTGLPSCTIPFCPEVMLLYLVQPAKRFRNSLSSPLLPPSHLPPEFGRTIPAVMKAMTQVAAFSLSGPWINWILARSWYVASLHRSVLSVFPFGEADHSCIGSPCMTGSETGLAIRTDT